MTENDGYKINPLEQDLMNEMNLIEKESLPLTFEVFNINSQFFIN